MNASSLVFIDESGINAGLALNYGWSPIGTAPVIERPMRCKNVTLIGAIALDGPRVLTRLEGTLDGDGFVRWIREDLGPTLKEGDVVVMDSPRLHRVAGVAEALAAFGATACYLPAYSPELNPIEMAWAWLKHAVRKAAPRRIARLRSIVDSLWKNLTNELCTGWIRHSGYTVSAST